MNKLALALLGIAACAVYTGGMGKTVAQEGASQTPAGMSNVPSIAIIGVLNLSGEKWEELKKKQVTAVTDYLHAEFRKRGFRITPSHVVSQCLADMKLDVNDEENHRRSVLYEIGRQLDVDFVLFGVIISTRQHERSRFLYTDVEGETQAKIWLLDVRRETSIVSGRTFTGRSGGYRGGPLVTKGSDRQMQSAINAFRDALSEFLRGFPVTPDNSPEQRKR